MKFSGALFYRFKLLLSDKTLLVAMLVLPVVFSWLSGLAVREESADGLKIAVVDEDRTGASALFLEMISREPEMRIGVFERQAAFERLKLHEAEAVFIISDGFGEKISEGNLRGLFNYSLLPSSHAGGYAIEVFAGKVITLIARHMSIERCLEAYREAGLGTSQDLVDSIGEYFDSHWDEGPLMQVRFSEYPGTEQEETNITGPTVPGIQTTGTQTTETQTAGTQPTEIQTAGTQTAGTPISETPGAKPSEVSRTLFLGMFLVFTMFYVMAGSGWLIDEREGGTLKRLRSVRRGFFYGYWGGAAALFAGGALQMTGSLILFRAVSGKTVVSGILSSRLVALLLLYILAAVSVSMFFSAVFKTRSQLQSFIPVYVLATGFLGGCFWGLPDLPQKIKPFALLTLQGWVLEALNGFTHVPYMVLGLVSLTVFLLSYILAACKCYA